MRDETRRLYLGHPALNEHEEVLDGALAWAVEEEMLLRVALALMNPCARRSSLGARKRHPRGKDAMLQERATPDLELNVGSLSVLLKRASHCSAQGGNQCLPRRHDHTRSSHPGLSSRLDKPGSGIILVARDAAGMLEHQIQTFTYAMARSYCVGGAAAFSRRALALRSLL